MSDNEQRNENRKTVDDILSEMERESIIHVYIPAIDLERYVKRIKEVWKRERDLIRSCARWILTHDIYGHMSKELLSECKNVLGDDGQFLNK